jgi:hypothetical protein
MAEERAADERPPGPPHDWATEDPQLAAACGAAPLFLFPIAAVFQSPFGWFLFLPIIAYVALTWRGRVERMRTRGWHW